MVLSKNALRLWAAGALMSCVLTAGAQPFYYEGADEGTLTGGFGFFSASYRNLSLTGLTEALPAGYPAPYNSLISFGGEGYLMLGRVLLGGGGFGGWSSLQQNDSFQVRTRLGSAEAKLGYRLVLSRGLMVFPTVGVGWDRLTLFAQRAQPVSFQQHMELGGSASLTQRSRVVLGELNIAQFTQRDDTDGGGLCIGLKLGYRAAFDTKSWESQNQVAGGSPRVPTSGFYVGLVIGGGGYDYD